MGLRRYRFKDFPCGDAGALAGELRKFRCTSARLEGFAAPRQGWVDVRQALKINDALLAPTFYCGPRIKGERKPQYRASP
jgi:hypothetical protein